MLHCIAAPQASAKAPDAAIFASAIPVPPLTPAPTAASEIAAADTAAADAAAAAAAGSGSNGARLAWRVVDYMGPKEAVGRFLPHLVWDREVPPILSFYSFASAEVVAA
jgi:hypothetical protein